MSKHRKYTKRRRLYFDRLEKYPDGYIETLTVKNNKLSTDKSEINKFIPVSIIVSTQDNLLLNKDNNYEVRFNTGMVEGEGICINEAGNIITFYNDGSYRLELCGEAVLFSDVDVKLVYQSSEFSEDVKSFSETSIPKDETKLKLRGIPTILPIKKNQSIITKLVPNPDESIILNTGTRLLIYRVA